MDSEIEIKGEGWTDYYDIGAWLSMSTRNSKYVIHDMNTENYTNIQLVTIYPHIVWLSSKWLGLLDVFRR